MGGDQESPDFMLDKDRRLNDERLGRYAQEIMKRAEFEAGAGGIKVKFVHFSLKQVYEMIGVPWPFTPEEDDKVKMG